jgi:hypothetical protein
MTVLPVHDETSPVYRFSNPNRTCTGREGYAGSAVNSFAMTGGRLLPEAFPLVSHKPRVIGEN